MITGRTELLCIVADPIEHVETPQVFNAYLNAIGANAVLVPVHVRPEDLASVVQGFRQIVNLRGIVVTVPHKIEILKYCDRLDESAEVIGAANVLRREPDGRLVGANFDGIGFLRSLESSTGAIEGKSVYMAGAGGVARAMAFSLAGAGISRLAIHNRSSQRGDELISAIGSRFPDLSVSAEGDAPAGYDVAINATSLGLRAGDPLPFDLEGLAASAVVADVVMQPVMTPLLTAAKDKGMRYVLGKGMLESQLDAWVEFIEAGLVGRGPYTGTDASWSASSFPAGRPLRQAPTAEA